MKNLILEIIVFIGGAVVMIFEIVGSRMLAPYLGTSIFVWTTLIGVILASLSIGYHYGGKIADKKSDKKYLSYILLLSALLITIASAIDEPLMAFLFLVSHNIKLIAIVTTILLFTPASVCLGMISPYAVRLRLHDVAHSGETVGNLYAISTVGSIVGTFASGFFLIPLIGTTIILYLLSAVLVLSAIILSPKNLFKSKLIIFAGIMIILTIADVQKYQALARGYSDTDTLYNRVIVHERKNYYSDDMIIEMNISGAANSARFVDKPDLAFPYSTFYTLAFHILPDAQKFLMLGGGGYSVPTYFMRNYPDVTMDVVEIDPGVTELAYTYFNLEENPRLNIIHEDARIFLNHSKERYDVILGDAFGSYFSVPYQLTTKESVQHMYDILHDNGIAIINTISAREGDKARFLTAEYKTIASVFPHVYVFPIRNDDPTEVQNIMVIASKSTDDISLSSDNADYETLLSHYVSMPEPDQDIPILTDEFAPVDYYIQKLL